MRGCAWLCVRWSVWALQGDAEQRQGEAPSTALGKTQCLLKVVGEASLGAQW